MFDFIRGTVCSVGTDDCVVEIGGIGFRVSIPLQTRNSLGEPGAQVTLYTYLSVKEDGFFLYGFASEEERTVFTMLLSVSGVGPKVALAVLSLLSPAQFALAVASGDHRVISRSKGVGPKLAQRIVLELKDKVKKDLQVPADREMAADLEGLEPGAGDAEQEAVSALLVLGYSGRDAVRAVRQVMTDDMTPEEVVRRALRFFMGGR